MSRDGSSGSGRGGSSGAVEVVVPLVVVVLVGRWVVAGDSL